MEKTASNTNLTMIVFLSYSGKWDILQAAKKMAFDMINNPEKAKELDNFNMEDFSL